MSLYPTLCFSGLWIVFTFHIRGCGDIHMPAHPLFYLMNSVPVNYWWKYPRWLWWGCFKEWPGGRSREAGQGAWGGDGSWPEKLVLGASTGNLPVPLTVLTLCPLFIYLFSVFSLLPNSLPFTGEMRSLAMIVWPTHTPTLPKAMHQASSFKGAKGKMAKS